MRRLLTDSGVYLVGILLQSGIGMILLPLATRVMTVDEFGAAGTATAVISVLTVLYSFGLSFAMPRFVAEEAGGSGRSDWAALIPVQIIGSGILMLAIYSLGSFWARAFEGVGWSAPLKFAVVAGWVSSMQATTLAVIRGEQRAPAFVAIVSVQVAVGSVSALLLAEVYGAGGYLAGLCFGYLLGAGLGLLLAYRRPRWSLDRIRSNLRISLPSVVHQFSGWAIDMADRLLIAGFLGVVAVAQYQVAYIIGAALVLALNGLQSAWVPFYMRNLTTESQRELPPQIVIKVSLVCVSASLVVVALSPVLMAVAAPSSYRSPSGEGTIFATVALVAAASAGRSGTFLGAAVLLKLGKTKGLASSSLVAFVLNITLNLALVPRHGIAGAALATFGALSIQSLLILKSVSNDLGRSMRPLMNLFLYCGGAAGALVLASTPTNVLGWCIRIFAVTVCVVVAAGLLQRTKLLVEAGIRTISVAPE